jgi:hypothetical protein
VVDIKKSSYNAWIGKYIICASICSSGTGNLKVMSCKSKTFWLKYKIVILHMMTPVIKLGY